MPGANFFFNLRNKEDHHTTSKRYINSSLWIHSLKVLYNFVYKKRKITNRVDKKLIQIQIIFGEVYYVLDLHVQVKYLILVENEKSSLLWGNLGIQKLFSA